MGSPPATGVRPERRLAATVAAVVVAVDAVTKLIAVHELRGKGIVNLLGGRFHLELYMNHAGPGNILQGHSVLVSLLSLTAVLLIAAVAWTAQTKGFAVAIGLLLGGGIGNLLDRIFGAPGPLRGGVIDWIKPTLSGGSMNLADLSINAAVIVFIGATVLDWRRYRAAERREASPAAIVAPPPGPEDGARP